MVQNVSLQEALERNLSVQDMVWNRIREYTRKLAAEDKPEVVATYRDCLQQVLRNAATISTSASVTTNFAVNAAPNLFLQDAFQLHLSARAMLQEEIAWHEGMLASEDRPGMVATYQDILQHLNKSATTINESISVIANFDDNSAQNRSL